MYMHVSTVHSCGTFPLVSSQLIVVMRSRLMDNQRGCRFPIIVTLCSLSAQWRPLPCIWLTTPGGAIIRNALGVLFPLTWVVQMMHTHIHTRTRAYARTHKGKMLEVTTHSLTNQLTNSPAHSQLFFYIWCHINTEVHTYVYTHYNSNLPLGTNGRGKANLTIY